jgi:hypothetical protein
VVEDKDYVALKYEDWKKKMICATCGNNENDTVLTCGHLSCS